MRVTINVRQLGDALSRYLHRAEGGERIVVTSHRRAIAALISPEELARLEELVSEERGKYQAKPVADPATPLPLRLVDEAMSVVNRDRPLALRALLEAALLLMRETTEGDNES